MKLYRNIKDFYVGNVLLAGMMFCSCSCMEKFVLDYLVYFYYTFKVTQRVTNLDIITVEQFMKLMRFWNNFVLIFVETLRLNGGLNHIIFLLLFLVLFVNVDVFCYFWNVIICLNTLLVNALLYKSLDLLKVASSPDKVLFLLDIFPGRFLILFGGWLKRMLIYNGLLSG